MFRASRRSRPTLASLVLGVLLLCVGVASGGASDLPPLRPEQPPGFTANVTLAVDREGQPSLVVTLSVPHAELQWVRLPEGGYGAVADFTVVLTPRKGERLYGGSWSRRLEVASFAEARTALSSLREERSYVVPPGIYDLRVELEDRQGGQRSSVRSRLEVPDYSRVPVSLSGLEVGHLDSTGAFVPSNTRRFGLEVSRLAGRATLLDRRPGTWPRRYLVEYRLANDQGEDLAKASQEVTLERSGDAFVIRPLRSDLFIGQYTMYIEVVDDGARARAERSFEVEESGPPRGREFERMLEPLAYVAELGEVDGMRGLPPEQQVAAWEAFWKKRDPTPDTPRNEAMIEFLRRVAFAERRFQGFGPGWRSDMGRIYIRYGPPENVDSRPASAQSPQAEIWYYSNPPRRFTFIDREGFGRYVLAGPGE